MSPFVTPKSELERLSTDQQPVAFLFLPDLEVLDFGRNHFGAFERLSREVMAD
jgi:hypothetical protein